MSYCREVEVGFEIGKDVTTSDMDGYDNNALNLGRGGNLRGVLV